MMNDIMDSFPSTMSCHHPSLPHPILSSCSSLKNDDVKKTKKKIDTNNTDCVNYSPPSTPSPSTSPAPVFNSSNTHDVSIRTDFDNCIPTLFNNRRLTSHDIDAFATSSPIIEPRRASLAEISSRNEFKAALALLAGDMKALSERVSTIETKIDNLSTDSKERMEKMHDLIVTLVEFVLDGNTSSLRQPSGKYKYLYLNSFLTIIGTSNFFTLACPLLLVASKNCQELE